MEPVVKNRKVSHMRQNRDEKDLVKLHSLLFQVNKDQWAIGDEVGRLKDSKGWKVGELANHFKYARNRLTEFYYTAKAFTTADRSSFSVPFSHYELARKASNKFPQWSPSEAFAIIQKDGLTQRREVTRHFAALLRKEDAANALNAMADRLVANNSIINNCHLEDCRTVAEKLPANSIKIAFVDTPYGDYANYKNGEHSKGSASLNSFDMGTTQEVLTLTEDLFRILHYRMTEGGVMLLCRPGGFVDPLHTNIIAFTEKYGWTPYRILTWHKGGAKLGNGTEPYTTDTENIWVLHRFGETISNHDNSSRSVVLKARPVNQKLETADDKHLFEKPVDLCKFLISKHSYEGELVFDACGCSASFCVAAIETNRSFVYSEIDEQNFALGRNNIAKALSEKEKSEHKLGDK